MRELQMQQAGKRHEGCLHIVKAMAAKLPLAEPANAGKNRLKSADALSEELDRISAHDNGAYPTWGRLRELKRYDLTYAITNFHGGYFNFKKKIRKKVDVLAGDDALALDRNFDKRLAEVRRVNRGKVPTRDTMVRQGFGDFVSAMYKRKMTISKLRADARQEEGMRRGEESLAHRKNRVNAAMKMMEAENLKVLPGAGWPGWKGKYSKLYTAIGRYDGLNRFKEEIGPYGLKKTTLEIYRQWEAMERALVKLVDKKGRLPALEWFVGNPMRQLELESIYTFHGNLWEARMRLECKGLTLAIYRQKGNAWRLNSPESVLKMAEKLAQDNNGVVPGEVRLEKMGLHRLIAPIKANGGSRRLTRKVREMGLLTDGKIVEPVVL